MTVRFMWEAQQEFLDAIRYYEEAEPGLGRRFSVEAESAVRRLCEHPETYRIRRADQRRINLKTFPFYLPFKNQKPKISIHQSSGSWIVDRRSKIED